MDQVNEIEAGKKKCVVLGTVGAVVLAALAADCAWLHVRCARQDRTLTELDAVVRTTVERIRVAEDRLQETADGLARTAKTAGELEKWVETSSVQGKFNAYCRQAEDKRREVVEKAREIRDSAMQKLKAVRDELSK